MGPVEAGLRQQPTDQVGGVVQRRRAVAVDVDRVDPFGQHLPGAVGQRDPHVTVPDVHPRDPAAGGGQRDQHRRPPAAALVRAATTGGLGRLAAGDELGHQAGHGGAREPGGPGEVGAAGRPLGRQQCDEGAPVPGAQPLEGALGGHGRHASQLVRTSH